MDMCYDYYKGRNHNFFAKHINLNKGFFAAHGFSKMN